MLHAFGVETWLQRVRSISKGKSSSLRGKNRKPETTKLVEQHYVVDVRRVGYSRCHHRGVVCGPRHGQEQDCQQHESVYGGIIIGQMFSKFSRFVNLASTYRDVLIIYNFWIWTEGNYQASLRNIRKFGILNRKIRGKTKIARITNGTPGNFARKYA